MALRARLNQRIRFAKNVGQMVLERPGLAAFHAEADSLMDRMRQAWRLCESLGGDRRELRAKAEPVVVKLVDDAASLLKRAERAIEGAAPETLANLSTPKRRAPRQEKS